MPSTSAWPATAAPRVVRERLRTADALLVIGSRLSEVTTAGYTLPAPGPALDARRPRAPARPPSATRPRPSSRSAPTPGRSCARPSPGSRRPVLVAAPVAARDGHNGADRAAWEAAAEVDGTGLGRPRRPPGPDHRRAPPAAPRRRDPHHRRRRVRRLGRARLPVPPARARSSGRRRARWATASRRRSRPRSSTASGASWRCSGDGGMGMTLAEVETAVREGAHVVAIVFDNEQYGMIHAHQVREGSPTAPGHGPRADRLRRRGPCLRGPRRSGRDRRRRSSPPCGPPSPRPGRRSSSSRWTAAGCRSTSPRRPERPMPRLTLHLVPEDDLGRARPGGAVPARRLRDDGFVHCTDGDDEMVAVANRFYAADPRPFLLLTLDLERTGSPWRFDDPERAVPARLRADRPGVGRRGAPHGALGRRRLHGPAPR